jgi:hypothetical protein
MGFSLPKIKISAPKISLPKLPTIQMPKGLDPSKIAKSALDTYNRSDVGLVTRSVAKAATFQDLDKRENAAFQNTVKVAAVAAGGYFLATSAAAGTAASAISSGAGSVGSAVVANPITSLSVASQLKSGNTAGAAKSAAYLTDSISQPALGDSFLSGRDSDTIKSLLINNQAGVRPTLANSSIQTPVVKTPDTISTPAVTTTGAQSENKNLSYLYIGGALVLGAIVLKKFKVI